ncbi:MAG: UDP-N-acetylmuramate dehydrogenase [Cyclobacteriaceae bacterium]|nr:UDP-N-acetylmuramate dehydrogenase [Cyclobacteriaceae bacterium]
MSFQKNIDLKAFNTFGIRAFARYFVTLKTPDDLHELFQSDLYRNEQHLIIGGGSNVLFTKDFDGLIIQNNIKGISTQSENDDNITVEVASGEVWHPFVLHCVNRNWGGVENLSLIPGTVGAAPMQNIGAYGVEIGEVIKKVVGINLASGEAYTFSREECAFGYRESVFKKELRGKFFISSVTLTLTKKNHRLSTQYGAINDTLHAHNITSPTIKNISDAVIEIRTSKLPDPTVLGNAGSFFKNPAITLQHYELLKKTHPTIPGYSIENQSVKVPAAWLIENCGWKGKRVGDAGVHQHQALVLVNYNAASGEEIFSLATNIRASVKEKFDVELVPEVNIV